MSGPRIILQRPDLAALLGAVASEWANLEFSVTMLYAYLMGTYLPRIEGFQAPIHPVALQVFETLETQRLRLNLLTKLAEWCIKDKSLSDELKNRIRPEIEAASRLRNTLVHGQWGVADDYPDGLILLPVFGQQIVYEASDFNEALNRIITTRDMVMKFEVKVRQSHERK